MLMPVSTTPAQNDWTSGPAKWVAVIVLGCSALVGLGWSILSSPAGGAALESSATRTGAVLDGRPPQPAGPRRININTATRAELELLPGIGPAVAQRIIDHRTARGPFKSAADLDDVKGVGPKTLEKLKDLVTIEEPSP